MRRLRNQRGVALIETAITLPMVLLVSVAIFEFGRAYQTWQVLTNAAREGARVSILADATDAQVSSAVTEYMKAGRIKDWDKAAVNIERSVALGPNTSSRITVSYPFNFMVIGPVAKLVRSASTLGDSALTMTSVALMRNES
jgi:Flp pilus assembly protein TadG